MTSHTHYLWFETKKRQEIIDITDEVAAQVRASGIMEGFVLVSAMHISASVFVNDHESGLWQDILRWLEETIAPWETEPALPVEGEALFYGTSNLFPEFGKVFVWNGERYVELDPSSFTFKADVMQVGPDPSLPAFASASHVVFRFPADKVNLIQNRFVLFQIFPMPSTTSPGDTVEGLFVRRP